ncbi:MAG TPA: YtzI protein [Bacillaceae bacterium]
MKLVMIISVIIIILVILATALTTSKAYSYKHTVDPAGKKPNENGEELQPTAKGK